MYFFAVFLILFCLSAIGCNSSKPWPESPLYSAPINDPNWDPPATLEEAKAALEGHYAHYDIVAYEEENEQGIMRTFIISYGFTDMVLEGDDLVEVDTFCHAEHKLNQSSVTSYFNDAATQAIKPRVKIVEVYKENGKWKVHRPQTPTLLGVKGNPDLPLTTDRNDPNIFDADGDGKRGVTVNLEISNFIKGELYIVRREIFQSYMTLHSDGTLFGDVVDNSEQLVIGASIKMFNKPANPGQYPDPGLSPIMLVQIPENINTCDQLMQLRDEFFPAEPEF